MRLCCFVLTAIFGLGLVSCADFMTPVALNGTSAQAQAGAPTAAQVSILSLPFDPATPIFTVTVEPFQTAAQGIVSGGNTVPTAPNQSYFYSNSLNMQSFDRPQSHSQTPAISDRVGFGVAAQLLTTLSRVGNLRVIDYETFRATPSAYANLYVIKGTVTEFSETAEAQDNKQGFSTLPLGKVAGDIGRAAGAPGLSLFGSLASHSNVASQDTATSRRGMVGLDLQVIQPKTGQIITSFPCQGTFVTKSATRINTAFGYQQSNADYQASALGQAQRAALNTAATQILAALKAQVK